MFSFSFSHLNDKIYELLDAEDAYLTRLQTICETYKPHFFDAVNPDILSNVPLFDFNAINNQHGEVFFYFEQFLELHKEFRDFLGECEDCPERIGELFFSWLSENRFDVYLHHAAQNPLKRRPAQKDFNGFLVSTNKLLLNSSCDCC